MSYLTAMAPRVNRTFLVLLLAMIVPQPARAYDYPLSPGAIREAYFLGTRQANLGSSFLAEYTRAVPQLKRGACTSEVRIVTPFTQVAEYAAKTLGYSAQDAIRDFYGKPLPVRIYASICYSANAPPPNSIRIKVMQNRKDVIPLSDERSPYYSRTDKRTFLPSMGEKIQLEFAPEKLDSSSLIVLIDTPDDRHIEVEFPLQTLR